MQGNATILEIHISFTMTIFVVSNLNKFSDAISCAKPGFLIQVHRKIFNYIAIYEYLLDEIIFVGVIRYLNEKIFISGINVKNFIHALSPLLK